MATSPSQICNTLIGSCDPTGGKNYTVFKAPADCYARILNVHVVSATTAALAAANYNLFTINRVRAASATAIGAQSNNSGVSTAVALAANVPLKIILTSAALSQLQPDDTLQLVCTEGAAGQDLTELVCIVEWVPGYSSV